MEIRRARPAVPEKGGTGRVLPVGTVVEAPRRGLPPLNACAEVPYPLEMTVAVAGSHACHGRDA